MDQIIKKLLMECSYVEKTQGISYYSKEDKSFFFIVSLSEANFTLLKNKDLINENQQYKEVLDGFKNIINSGEQTTIEKNSSLIVLVKCSGINAIGNLQQQILLFEEDEYFFKKYVILYTEASVVNLAETPLLPALIIKINNSESFDKFASEGYKTELAEYLVIMQLFIKLPFLRLNLGTEEFTSLSQKISSILGVQTLVYTSLQQNADALMAIDFSKPEQEAEINQLLSLFPNG